MSIFATLDDIELEVTLWPDAMDARYQAAYATQDLIGTKGLLQHTGFAPDEVDMTATLHANWCNPGTELTRLKTAMDARQAMALVLGSGEYRGVFVITALDVATRQTDGGGAALALELNLKLKEFIGDPAAPYLPGVVGAGLRVPLVAQAAPEFDFATFGGPLAQVASVAGSALGAAQQVATVAAEVASFADLAQQNPASALLGLPGLASRVGVAAGGLPIEALQGLQQVAAVAADAGALVQTFGQAKSLMQSAGTALGTGLGGASAAAWNTATALRSISSARAPLARLTQASALRLGGLWV
ncbi:phage tail protein [Rhodoferax sp.]|uniref:phage tail protein n=1 Tax=Rhodoferax sp. TaxID=50421 RepID=UPI002637BFB1|nr:phage tail protein [Rhodoferax sp.]MDD3938076.1 phage tail protein [Rhodoferax sp.]